MRMDPPALAQDAPGIALAGGAAGGVAVAGAAPGAGALDSLVMEDVRRVWGFDALRPLQAEAIAAGIAGRDSLVVMPTGGGKSLCYQVPPLAAARRGDARIDVCVSPLIALMKDQVDGLRTNGYPAAALHSGMGADDREAVRRSVRA
ncbi:MAG: DEAD/DEAH box helicase, partial [Phycisphaerales bacterium]